MRRGVTWLSGPHARWAIRGALVLGCAGIVAPAAGPSAHAVESVDVIIRAREGDRTEARALIEGLGGSIDHEVALINGFIATMPADRLDDLQLHQAIADVDANAVVEMAGTDDPTTDIHSVFGAREMVVTTPAWNRGFTGKGIGIAVIDTGVTPVRGLDGPGKVIYGPDLTPEANGTTGNLDGYGHGTFMAGLIAGNDDPSRPASTAPAGEYLGIAPDAHIVSVKVGDAQGETVVGSVIMALDWVISNAADPDLNIRIVNLSFSTDSTQTYLEDPLAFAVERAWLKGLVVVTAAGNSGHESGKMTMPAADPYVIAVGATDPQGTKKVGDDTAATFSSGGDNVRNPDILAPGTSLQGLRVPGSFADVHFGTTAAFGDRFIRGSGTSQATAIVSGAAAIVLSHRPHLTPDQVKAVLTRGAVKLPKVRDAAQGRGILNISRALGGRDPLVIQAWKRSSGLGSIVESGGTWVDPNWSGGTWSGGTWSGGTWSGGTWSGGTWSGNTWSGNTWSSAGWN